MFAVNAFYNAAQLTYNLALCYISTYVYVYPLYQGRINPAYALAYT